jgi:putative ABC transport system permease protein
MTRLRRYLSGLRALLWKAQAERELDDELRAYLQLAIDRKMAAGLSRDAATRAARAEMGSLAAIKDHVRDAGWEFHLETFLQDLRFGVRSFVRAPRFTVPALITLALGIGATAAMFSVINTVLFEPLPYHEPDRIVAVWETNRGGARRNSIAPANFVAWTERARTLQHLGMVGSRSAAILVDGEPLQVSGLRVTSEVFRTLRVAPALGRAFTAEEDAGRTVILLSHEFWQRALGGRRDVLGLMLSTDGERRTVIGVMAPRFTIAGQPADFLVPYGISTERFRATRGRANSYAVARIVDGVSFDTAHAEMRAIYAELEKENPQLNAARTVMLFRLQDQMVGDIRLALLTVSGAVALVLVLACVNVANLLLARSTARGREVEMRRALGARRGRLVRQMLTESLVLAAAAGVAGLGVAALLHRGLLLVVSSGLPIPRLDQVALDFSVVLFAMIVTLGTGIAFGVVPAVISTSSTGDAVRAGGRHGGGRQLHRALDALVIGEIALSLLLLVGAGLLMRSFVNQTTIDTGYRTDGVLTARVRFPASSADVSRATTAFQDTLARMSALPGVQHAAAATCLLPPHGCGATSVWRLDRPTPPAEERRSSQIRPISPAFFATLGIPLLAGRDFFPADTVDSTPVAIVNESAVREYFTAESPLERQLHINTIEHANGRGDMPWTVVGVARDIKSSLDGRANPVIYVPLTQMPDSDVRFFVRTDRGPELLAPSVMTLVRSTAPEAPVDVRTLDDVVADTIARPRAVTVLVTAFALVALLLAAIGVYGVIAYSVRARTQELSLRIALGATGAAIARLVLGHAGRLAAIGIIAGVGLAAALSRLLQRLLFGVEAFDPWTFALTPLILLLVASAAAYAPARRAMRAAPTDVLRAN